MNNEMKTKIIDILAKSLDIPDSAYEAAANRYRDLGEWLHDKSKAKSAQYNPDVFPQGSFRLGTATKPWKREDYDIDLSCNLKSGITREDCSQAELKQLIGEDLNAYREERGIRDKIEEKHRCWRVNYQDNLNFHMDIVPSIPQAEDVILILKDQMIKAGSDEVYAHNVSELALAVTDDRHRHYRVISADWEVSNPEGYARWFESRMRQARELLKSRAMAENVAKVEDLPTYKWKTPLQRSVQVLKRHRDVMFERNPDGKPISIIITTLAARAYRGETDLYEAIDNILARMGDLVFPKEPRVPNPVDPREDFADKWGTPEGRNLSLERNFWLWLAQAKSDFNIITSSQNDNLIAEQAMQKFGARLEGKALSGIAGPSGVITAPKSYQIAGAGKPWLR
jgi:hypothetical protein